MLGTPRDRQPGALLFGAAVSYTCIVEVIVRGAAFNHTALAMHSWLGSWVVTPLGVGCMERLPKQQQVCFRGSRRAGARDVPGVQRACRKLVSLRATAPRATPEPLPYARRHGVMAPLAAIWTAAAVQHSNPSQAAAVSAPEEVDNFEDPVVDEGNVLDSSTRLALTSLLRKFEKDTNIKVRVLCPPSGSQQTPEQWREFVRPIKKRWGIDEGGLVVVAEQPAEWTGRQMQGPKATGFLQIAPGFKLQERFQYTLTKDYTLRTASAFGNSEYVKAHGVAGAILAATENVVAAMYELLDRRLTKLPRVVRGYREPMPADEVSAILKRHGA